MNTFQVPMQPWPLLARHGQTLSVSRGRIKLFFYDSGPSNKPPLLLLHGLGDEADTWRHVFAALAERHRVLAPDLPGFGRSDKPRRIYTLGFLRDSLLELLDALSLKRCALMGSSLGAVLAQAIAMKCPARVTGLVLSDGTITTQGQSFNPALLKMTLPILGPRGYTGLRGHPQAAYESLRPFYGNLDALPAADRQFLYQRVNERVWSDGQRDAFFSVLRQLVWWLPLRQRQLEARLARQSTPTTLLIWGEKDAINPVASAHRLMLIQPGVRLTVLPDVGHLPQQEDPQGFLLAATQGLP